MTARAALIGVYVGLAILTGAVSFDRKLPLTEAADYQRRAWKAFVSGGDQYESTFSDLNLDWYTRRALMPALTAAMVRTTGLPWPYAFSVLRLGMLVLCYCVFHSYLRGWFSRQTAMAGTFFLAASLPLTFKDWLEIPTDIPEILTFTVGLWLIRENRLLVLPFLTLVGTLNRETAVYLPVLALLTAESRVALRSRLPIVIVSMAIWLAVFFGVQWWTSVSLSTDLSRNAAHHAWQGLSRFLQNLNPYNNFLYYFYLFGALWFLPLGRLWMLPVFLRRILVLVAVHPIVAFVGGGGRIDEPRQLCLLYPIIVPAALFALFGRDRGEFSSALKPL